MKEHETLQGRGLEAAARYLETRGYSILELGWAASTGDAADIIARTTNGTIVFVDVETSGMGAEMPPMETGSMAKRSRVEALAIEYLSTHRFDSDIPLRFDTIAIVATGPDRAVLRHQQNCLDGLAA